MPPLRISWLQCIDNDQPLLPTRILMNNQPYHRKPLRLQGYDYTQANAYFITICTHQRMHLFGTIHDGIMGLSPVGEIAETCWHSIPEHHPGVQIDAWIVMPNHVHGILWLPGGGAALGTVVGTYKAAVTRQTNRTISPALATLWQSSYHDRIIRDERGLQRIRRYIRYNAASWQKDRLSVEGG